MAGPARRLGTTARETPPWPVGDRQDDVFWRHRAEWDLADIYLHIGDDSPRAASRFADAVEHSLDLLLSHPRAGRAWQLGVAGSELRAPVIREFPHFLIFDRPTPQGSEVIRVLHGARDLPLLFAAEEP